MNNIQKNFKGKAKRGLCMATGGILDQAERDQLRFDQAQSMKQDALVTGNAQIGEIAGARGLSNRQRSRSIGEVRGVMSNFGAVGDQPSIRGLSARQQNSAGIADFTSGLRAQSANNTLAAADPALTAAAPTSAPTVQPDDRGWKRVDIANGGMFMADGGIVGSDGLTDAQRAKLSGARTNLGVSNAATAPAPAAPAPAAEERPRGILGILGNRAKQIDKAAGYAGGGLIGNAAEYWANDNAEFEKTKPGLGSRVVRAINPMTGFGSAMGAMHTAAGNGDIPGMAMAGISAMPAFGVLRAVPATGAIKAGVQSSPSLGRSAAAAAGGATANAAADDYQSKIESGYAGGGVVGAKTFEFEGKGTGTSDDIPVKVAGNSINVSDGEKAVILPAKTAQNPQALDMIEDVIEQSNGKPPNRGLRNGGNYNLGGFVDDYGNLNPPNRFQKAVPNEILRQQVNNAAPGAQLLPNQTTAMAEQAAANRPAPAPAAKPAGLMKNLGRAAQVAGVVSNGIDMVNAEAPAEQVAAAIKGGAMAVGPWTGTAVNLGDEAVNYATGGKHNLATGLDAGARWLSNNMPGMKGDYMQKPEFQPGGGGSAAVPEVAPTAEAQTASRAALTSTTPQMSTPANFVPEAVASATPKLDAEVTRRGLSGLKTIGTTNGNVTTGRDKNGQLNVMAGLDNTDAQNEALRAKEADRMTKDLARQVQVFDGLRAERLQRSPDASERAMGLAQAQQQILQQQNRNTAAHNEATMADAKEGRSIQRAAQAQQADQFNKTLAAHAATAKAAADKASVEDADKLVEESGYKGDALTEFRDAIRMNTYGGKQLPDGTVIPTAGDFDKMTMAQKRKVLPAIKAAHEYTKAVNAASGTGRSAEFPELQSERPMNFNDVATDPDSFLGLPRWRGKDNKIGVADLIEAKLDPRVNGNMYQFNGGRTVRANAIKGDMGPLKSNDMAALRKTQLERK